MLSTQIADVRNTATVEADRILITVEHAQTEVHSVDNQTRNLVATLVERGTPTEAIGNITPLAATLLPPPTQPAVALVVTEDVASQNNPVATGGPATPAPPPTVAGPPRLSSIVTAEGVDSNDCAVNATSTFTSDAEQIYVVAVAAGLQPGSTVVTSRWRQEGTQVATFDLSPDFTEGCLWFFMDQTDVVFTPGNWSVELEINGGLVGAPVPFAIVAAG